MHFGKALRGICHPRFKDGARSKYLGALSAKLAESFEAMLGRKDLLTLSSEVALLDARLADVLRQADFGESLGVWGSLRAEWAKFEEAMAADFDKGLMLVPEIARLIKAGGSDWELWLEIQRLIELRRRLVESESKRILQSQQTLTSSEAHLIFQALLSVIIEHVPDREQRARIQSSFLRIVSNKNSEVI